MKNFSILSFILILQLTSCVKDTPNVDFNKLGTIAEITTSNVNSANTNALTSGLENFNAATLPFIGNDSAFDVTFTVNIASPYPPTKDVNVTVAMDDAKRTSYNVALDSASKFLALPDSAYSFKTKTVAVKAGTRLANFTITLYPQKIDPVKSYLFPVTLMDASGITLSGNFSTIYFHIIGNPLAGDWQWDWTRWNNATGTGTPLSSSFTGDVTTFVPTSGTEIAVGTGYYDGANYYLSFTNNGGVLSDFKVRWDPKHNTNTDPPSIWYTAGIFVDQEPKILQASYSADKKVFEFQYIVHNSSGSRYIIDKYYRQ